MSAMRGVGAGGPVKPAPGCDGSGKRRGHSSCTLPCETGDRRRAVMSDSREIDEPGEPIYPDGPVRKDDPKVRQCLRCLSDFTIQWAGERISPRCMGTRACGTGIPAHSEETGVGDA